jgi:hypothetical protein
MDRQYVGVDLHRRRSVIYTMDAEGEKLDCVRIANDPLTLLSMVSKAGPEAEVVIEVELPRFRGHLIVSFGSREGVLDGASVEVSSGVPARNRAPRSGVG